MSLERISENDEIKKICTAARTVRQSASVTLGAVARRSDRSVSCISEIEHGKGTLGVCRAYLRCIVKMAAESDGPWFSEVSDD